MTMSEPGLGSCKSQNFSEKGSWRNWIPSSLWRCRCTLRHLLQLLGTFQRSFLNAGPNKRLHRCSVGRSQNLHVPKLIHKEAIPCSQGPAGHPLPSSIRAPALQALCFRHRAQAVFQHMSWLKRRAERPNTNTGNQRLMQTHELKYRNRLIFNASLKLQ